MEEQGGDELAAHVLQLHAELTKRCPDQPSKYPGFAFSLPPPQKPNRIQYAAFRTQ